MAEEKYTEGGDPIPYRKKIYTFLTDNFSDFKRSEIEFNAKLDSDPEYAGSVYKIISENFSDFKRPKEEFISLIGPTPKKKDLFGSVTTYAGQLAKGAGKVLGTVRQGLEEVAKVAEPKEPVLRTAGPVEEQIQVTEEEQLDPNDLVGSLQKTMPPLFKQTAPVADATYVRPSAANIFNEQERQRPEVIKNLEKEKQLKDLKNAFTSDLNLSTTQLMRATGRSANEIQGASREELGKMVREGNQSDRLAAQTVADARDIRQAFTESENLEQAAIKLAALKDPQVARQIEITASKLPARNLGEVVSGTRNVMGDPKSLFGEATLGRMIYQLASNPVAVQEIEKNPELKKQFREAIPLLINKYPSFGKSYLGNVISQKMEDMGMNNALLNIVTKEETDKVVDELVSEGKMSPLEVQFYKDNMREGGIRNFAKTIIGEQLYKTPGLIERTAESAVSAIKSTGAGAAEVTGLRPLLVGERAMVARDVAARDEAVNIRPRGTINEISAFGGDFLGQVLPTGLLGKGLTAAKVFQNPDNAIKALFGLQAFGNYMPQARAMFPGEGLKQRAYAGILAGLEIATENIFRDKKVVDGLLGKVKPEIASVINKFTAKQISAAAAREAVEGTIAKAIRSVPQFTKYFAKGIGENTFEETVTQLGQQLTDGVFTGKKFNDWVNGEELFETARTSALGSTFIASLSARADMIASKGMTAKMVYDMAEKPEYWIEKIRENAETDPDLQADAEDKIANLEYATKVRQDLEKTNLTEKQKIKFLINALDAHVKGKTSQSITDPVLKKRAEQEAKVVEQQQEAILNGDDQGEIEGDLSDEVVEPAGEVAPEVPQPELKYIEAKGDDVQDVQLKGKEYQSETMSPDEYLQETGGYASTFIDQKKVDKIKEKIKNGTPLDPLTLTSKEGSNIGQEGRHRAEAAKQLGIKEIPVVRIEGELPQAKTPEVPQTVEQLRAAEQAEYAAMADPNDEAKRQEIYDRYDKLITPLLEKEKEVSAAAPVPSIIEVKSPKEVKQGDTVLWRGEEFVVDEVNNKGGFNLRNKKEPTWTVTDARITDEEFQGKRGEVVAAPAVQKFGVGFAPFREKNVFTEEEDVDIRNSPDYQLHQENVQKVAQGLGIKINNKLDTWGGYVDSETGNPVQEVSNIMEIEATPEQARLMAAILGKAAPEMQDSVLLGNYNEQGAGIEHIVKTGSFENAQEAIKLLKDNGLQYFSVDKNSGDVIILDLDATDTPKIINLVKQLNENGIQAKHKYGKVNAEFIGSGDYDGIIDAERGRIGAETGFDIDAFVKEAAGKYDAIKAARTEPVVPSKPTIVPKEVQEPIVKRISKSIQRIFGKKESQIATLTGKEWEDALAAAKEGQDVNFQSWGAFEKTGFEETPEYKKLLSEGKIREAFDIKNIAGKPVVVINPDNMMTGVIISKDGKPIINGNGGINFVSKFGDVWASSDQATATTLAKYINEARELDLKNGGDGVVQIVVTKGTLAKSLTSQTGAKGAMAVLENLVDKGLIGLKDFRKSLTDVGKKYGIDFDGRADAKSIHSDIASKFFGVDDSSFSRRGTFIEDVINHLSENSESVHNNIEGIRDALNSKELISEETGKPRKINFAKAGVIDALGLLFSDNMTKGVPSSHAYATIEVSKPVKVEKGEHESYPFHIRQEDGSRPTLNILSDKRHVTEIVNDKNNAPVLKNIPKVDAEGNPILNKNGIQLTESGAGKLGSNQIGMAKGFIKSESELPKNDVQYMTNSKGEVYGFEKNGNIFLNGDYVTPNTPIHEAGHIWTNWAEQNRGDLFNTGLSKIEGSRYLKDVESNPFYQEQASKLPEDQRQNYFRKEALAKAIGDNGEKFVTESKKNDFKQWVLNLWRNVIREFGIRDMSAEQLSKLTIDEFSKKVAADIFGGKPEQQLKTEGYAVQEQAAGEVPVQPKAGVSKEVEGGVPGAKPKEAAKEAKAEGKEKVTPPVLPTEKPKTELPSSGKEREKSFLNAIYRAKGTPEAAKKGMEAEGLTYKTSSQKEARELAKSIVDELGIDEAVNIAQKQELNDGDVNAFIMGRALEKLADLETAATSPEEKLAYAYRFKEVAIAQDRMARSKGRYNAAIGDFYRKSPLGVVLYENAKRQDNFTDWSRNKEESWKDFYARLMEEPEFSEIVGEEVSQKVKAERAQERVAKKEKAYKAIDGGIAKVKDFIKKNLTAQLPEGTKKAGASIDIDKILDAAGGVMKKAYDAGETVREAVQKAIDYISAQVGNKDWGIDEFRKSAEDSFESVEGKKRKYSEETYRKKLINQIKDIDEQLAEMKRKPKAKKEEKEYQEETKKLIEERNAKKKQLDEAIPVSRQISPESVLNRIRKKLDGLTEKEKSEVVRNSFSKIVESGGLNYDDFKAIIAKVTGRGELTPEEAARIKELVNKTNAVEAAAQRAIELKTPQALKDYKIVQIEAAKAAAELNQMLDTKVNISERINALIQLNTLGAITLLTNPLLNAINQIGVRFPVYTSLSLIDKGIGAAAKAVGGKYETDPGLLSLQAQKDYFKNLGLGLKEAGGQLWTGLNRQDYTQKELTTQRIRPLEAWKSLFNITRGKQKASTAQIIDKTLQALPGVPAEIVARSLNLGDKPFRFATEAGLGSAFSKKLGLTDIDYEFFLEFPREEAYRAYKKQGLSDKEAGEKADYVKDVIINEGKKATFTQDNVLNDLVTALFENKAFSGTGSIIKTLTISPYIKVPANAWWSYYNMLNPEVALLQAMYYGGKSAKQTGSAKKMSLRDARYWFGHAAVGIATKAVIYSLVQAGIVNPGSDEEETKKEREGKRQYTQPGTINIDKLQAFANGENPDDVKGGLEVPLKYWGHFGQLSNSMGKQYEDMTPEQRQAKREFWDYLLGKMELEGLKELQDGIFANASSLLAGIKDGDLNLRRYGANIINLLTNIVQPATIAQISRAELPYQSTAKADDFLTEIKNNMLQRSSMFRKLAKEMPPAKIGLWGDVLTKEGGTAQKILGVSKANDDAFAAPVWELYKKTGDDGYFPSAILPVLGDNKLNVEQTTKLQQYVGEARKNRIAPVVNDEADLFGYGVKFSELDDADKKMVLSYLYQLSKDAGAERLYKEYPELAPKEKEVDIMKKIQKKLFMSLEKYR